MARSSPIQSNFNAGKLSKRLEGRVDLAKYANGCRELTNFIPQVQGPAQKRSGTRFVLSARITTGIPPDFFRYAHRMIPFEFSTDDAYVLVFSHNTVWFAPGRRTETLTSQRNDPSSMLPSQVPR